MRASRCWIGLPPTVSPRACHRWIRPAFQKSTGAGSANGPDRAMSQSATPPGQATVAVETAARLLTTKIARPAANASTQQYDGRVREAAVSELDASLSRPRGLSRHPRVDAHLCIATNPSARRDRTGRVLPPKSDRASSPSRHQRRRRLKLGDCTTPKRHRHRPQALLLPKRGAAY